MIYESETNTTESTAYDVEEMASAIEALNTAEQIRHYKAMDIVTKRVKVKQMENRALKEKEAEMKMRELRSYASLGFEN